MARQGSTCKGWKIVGSSPNDPICSKVLPNPNCPTTFAHSLLSSEDKWNYNWLFVPDWQHFTAMHPMKFSHVSCHEKQFYCKDRRNSNWFCGLYSFGNLNWHPSCSCQFDVAVINLVRVMNQVCRKKCKVWVQATLIPILFIDPFIGLMMVFRSQLYEINYFFLIVHYNWGTDKSHSQMLGKFEYSGGPIFKMVLEC